MAVGLIFGGGLAAGLALSNFGGHAGVGNGGPGSSQGGLPGDSGRGDRGTRPEVPNGGTNQERPTAPNSGDTGNGDTTQEG